ncbi:MAG: Crp/Fnr family transcriptional regulator [Anaerolineae bacterium]
MSESQQDVRDSIRSAKLFVDLPPPLVDQLAISSRIRALSSGEVLFHQGDPASTYYLLQSGAIRLVQHTADGKDVTIATFGADDLIGLLVALNGDPYPATAEVLSDSVVIAFGSSAIWDAMNQHAPLAVRVLRLMGSRLHEAHDRIRELSVERVQQRIARSLVRLASKVGVKQPDGSIYLDLRLSRQDLAQMNGTTLETVSRTLTGWQKAGIVDSGREHITILAPHRLVLIAEDADEHNL